MSIEAVIFDWGGTLTPWHAVDLHAQWLTYAQAYDPAAALDLAQSLLAAETALWNRQRASAGAEGTGNLDHVFASAGVDVSSRRHGEALSAYLASWDPHTYADPDARALLEGLRAGGLKIGVLSNTLWPRAHHEQVFARDGLLDLIDGAVYTSETISGKPHESAFRAALDSVGVADPRSAVFVGDRIWDDIHGAQSAGMRAMLVPHSQLPPEQQVWVEVTPDAVVGRLGDVLGVLATWD
ncbi:MAG: HAD family hydrolase [Candidatus Nanopelagicales bacterium]